MGNPAEPVTVPAAELAALRAIAATALTWTRGRCSGIALEDTVRQYMPLLDPDPGLHLAWPETERQPVAGVDYLPTLDEDAERNYTPRRITGTDPVDGFDPAPGWPKVARVA